MNATVFSDAAIPSVSAVTPVFGRCQKVTFRMLMAFAILLVGHFGVVVLQGARAGRSC